MNHPVSPPPASPTIVGVLAVLYRHRRLLVGLPLALGLVGAARALLTPREYVVTTRFVPQASGSPTLTQLGGLAAQFGLPLGGVGSGGLDGSDFYAEIVESRDLLLSLRGDSFPIVTGRGRADTVYRTLEALWAIEAPSEATRQRDLFRELTEAISAGVGLRTSIVTVNVRTRWPEVSSGLAARLLTLLEEYNTERRQSQAVAERRFVERRLAEAQEELRDAEEALATFESQNRQLRDPALEVERDRLRRAVELRQTVSTSLAQAYEQARIDEVRDIPVLTVVDGPHHPPVPVERQLIRRTLVPAVAGLLVALGLAFTLTYIARERAAFPDAYGAFVDRLGRGRRSSSS